MFVTTQYNKRIPTFCRDYENIKDFLTVLYSYMPKQVWDGAGGDGSDEISDVDNEIGDDVGLVGSK